MSLTQKIKLEIHVNKKVHVYMFSETDIVFILLCNSAQGSIINCAVCYETLKKNYNMPFRTKGRGCWLQKFSCFIICFITQALITLFIFVSPSSFNSLATSILSLEVPQRSLFWWWWCTTKWSYGKANGVGGWVLQKGYWNTWTQLQ